MTTNIKSSKTSNLDLKFCTKIGFDTMKIEENTIVLLPNGDLTTGENIIRALKLEERILKFAKEGENNG